MLVCVVEIPNESRGLSLLKNILMICEASAVNIRAAIKLHHLRVMTRQERGLRGGGRIFTVDCIWMYYM